MAPSRKDETTSISSTLTETNEDFMEASAENASSVHLITSDYQKDPDVEEIPTAGYKCDLIFNVFQNRAYEEPEYMKKLRVIFEFHIMKNGKHVCTWTADNKSGPEVVCYREAARNVRPDCIISMDDDDMLKVMLGKVNPQRLFMMGRIKIKGNIMLLQRLNTLWLEFQKLGKTPEIPLAAEILLKDPLLPGLKSEFVVIELIQRIVRLPGLRKSAAGLHQIVITKDGNEVSYWLIDLTKDTPKIYRGQDPRATSYMVVEDYDFAKLVLMKLSLPEQVSSGRIKVKGDRSKLLGLEKLFSTPTSLRPKL